jgi:hypothetical protein
MRNKILPTITIFSIFLIVVLTFLGLSGNPAFAGDVTPPTVIDITGDTTGTTGEKITLIAVVEDDVGVTEAVFHIGDKVSVSAVKADSVQDTYKITFPLPVDSTDDIPYYFEASDAAGNTVRSPEVGAYTITVIDNDPPTVEVIQPNGGETLGVGRLYKILWTAKDNIGVTSIDLRYSTDNGSSWKQIATGEKNDGVYEWKVPDTPSTKCLVKVIAYDAEGNNAEDVSDNVFTIKKFEILYPFFDDMENPDSGNWNFDPPWGYTTSASHSGNASITDSPAGDYANNVNISATISAGIDLSGAIMPVLTFWHRYSLEPNADFGYLDVSADLGKTWSTIYFVTGHHTDFKEDKIDLTPYSLLSDVRIRFRLQTNDSITFDGWYIDDVSIDETTATVSYPFFDDMESGTENWLTSSWELFIPGHSPDHCLTDSPVGNTPYYVYPLLTLASTIDLSKAKNPQLTFWHHYYTYYDYCYVDVSTDKGRTYTTLRQYYGQQANWVQEQIDLKDYVGLPTVRIRFWSYSWGYDGWYIDDVKIEDTPEPHPKMYNPTDVTMHGAHLSWEPYQPSSFPSVDFGDCDRYEIYRSTNPDVNRSSGELVCSIPCGLGITECDDVYSILEPNYYYYRMYVVDVNGIYSIGSNVVKAEYTIPKVGYPFHDDMESGTDKWEWSLPWNLTTEKPHSGSYSWSDSPGGPYANNVNTALTTSIDLSSAVMPVLTFWHSYILEPNADFGYVDVSTDKGTTWSTIYFVTGRHTDWKEEKIDLTPYSDPLLWDVRIRFRLQTNGSTTYDGWYIDDVSIDETKATVSYPFFDNMESGTDNWFTSSWELFIPGHSPDHCLTDSSEGNTPYYVNTSLTLASTIDLSKAKNPQLTFWHHYYICYCYVEVSTDKGHTYTKLKEYCAQQTYWVQEQIDLKGYVGLPTVRIRFRVYATSSGYDGWYIDDVRIGENLSTLVDWCKLDSPASTSTPVGVPTENIYGLVYEKGVTEPVGQGAGIIAQLGYGSDGSMPDDDNWTWVDAAYDSDVDDKDKYVATLTVGIEGIYDYCYRYQLEGTGVWTYGDLDGNDLGSGGTNGYSPDHAGELVVTCDVGAIAGCVTDQGGNPIVKATVIAVQKPTKKPTKTGVDGCYEITDLQPGGWLVVCIKDGYGTGIKKVKVEPCKTTRCDFVLKPKLGQDEDEFAELLANYPDPFNPETWLPYYLSHDADVTIRIYNSLGQLVRTLTLGRKTADIYLDKDEAAYWDGKNEAGEKVASGVYFYQLQAGNSTVTRKMLMVK